MSKRLLNALEYQEANFFNPDDENSFRKLIVWLESNKIQKADENIANSLKNINANNWQESYNKYKAILGCPPCTERLEELQWILGYAIQVETSINRNIYLKHAVENIKITSSPNVVTENPLDKLDFHGNEFKQGINQLAKLLNITPHPDSSVTLEAIRKLVTTRLSPQAVENPSAHIVSGIPFPIQDVDLGFDLKDPDLNKAAKVLRMIYIQDLRNLQTKANELIVAVQNVTANPKTDTRLGRVGR